MTVLENLMKNRGTFTLKDKNPLTEFLLCFCDKLGELLPDQPPPARVTPGQRTVSAASRYAVIPSPY